MAASLSDPFSIDCLFDKERHMIFLEMMYQLLPSDYQPQEINHLTLAYFTLSSLDILGALDQVLLFILFNSIFWNCIHNYSYRLLCLLFFISCFLIIQLSNYVFWTCFGISEMGFECLIHFKFWCYVIWLNWFELIIVYNVNWPSAIILITIFEVNYPGLTSMTMD